MMLLGCVGTIALAVFGKFALDFVGIMNDRKRQPPWSDIPRPAGSPSPARPAGGDQWSYHPPPPS
jgi:hypothetical protein